MHALNHPNTTHYCESVFKVDPVKITGNQPVGLAWFSPDCFPAGTLILTNKGYRHIESIDVGARVLTHSGAWRRVTAVMKSEKRLYELSGPAHPGLRVSGEHPFLTRRSMSDAPVWRKASEVEPGMLWAHPGFFADAGSPGPRSTRTFRVVDQDLMWATARHIAPKFQREVVSHALYQHFLCRSHEDAPSLRARLEASDRFAVEGKQPLAVMRRMDADNVKRLFVLLPSRAFRDWVAFNFFQRGQPRISPWVLSLEAVDRAAFLEGFAEAIGDRDGHAVVCSGLSKETALGLKTVAASIGYTSSLLSGQDGRWAVTWTASDQLPRSDDRRHVWSSINRVTSMNSVEPVFNLSVEVDESYVAEGIVVHNCTHFSRARGGAPKSPRVRGLMWVVIRWAGRAAISART